MSGLSSVSTQSLSETRFAVESGLRDSKSLLSRWRELCSFSSLLVALFFTALYIFCSNCPITNDPDIWWHLRNAQFLLQHHSFLRQDVYTFTIQGKPWINPEWLAELPYYFAWRWAGYRGIFVVAATMIELLVAGCCILSLQQSKNIRSSLLAGVAFVLMATVSFGPRTQIFGWLCFIAELYVLDSPSDKAHRIWFLPLLFILWVNLHGSWPLGIAFLLIYLSSKWNVIVGDAIFSEGLPLPERRRFVYVAVLSALALFVNPYGWRLVTYPFIITLQHPLTTSFVEEWQSLNFHSLRGFVFFMVIAALAAGSTLKKRSWPLHELVFLLISALAALTYSRFLLLAGIVVIPYLARELTFLSQRNRAADKPVLNAALILVLLIFVSLHIPAASELKERSEKGYPAKAAAYLRTHPSDGVLLNDFNWGGYLEWNAPASPMFIDTRADAFEHLGLLADYIDTVRLRRQQQVLKKYAIQSVLFPTGEPLMQLLRQTPGWVVEYEDDTAVLLRHTTP